MKKNNSCGKQKRKRKKGGFQGQLCCGPVERRKMERSGGSTEGSGGNTEAGEGGMKAEL